MRSHRFLVITEVPDPEGPRAWENLALSIPTHFSVGGGMENVRPIRDSSFVVDWLAFRGPVFTKGEVLIVNLDGRESFGRMRKPSRWGVEYEEFKTIEEAIACAEEVNE